MPNSSHASDTAQQWLARLQSALDSASKSGNGADIAELFGEECFWRDLIAFTWNIATLEGKQQIGDMVASTATTTRATNFQLTEEATENDGVVEASFTFETDVAHGRGLVRLKNGACWTLLTAMTELKGHEEQQKTTRWKGTEHGACKNRETWTDKREKEARELGYTKQPYCLIIGGGQAGIILAARLKRLGVPALVVDKNKRPGDTWRGRYKSLCLHDPVWYDHLPYLPFPDHWPVFTPKDKMGDWLECYAKIMEINYWNSSVCEHAEYDEAKKEWTVRVNRDGETVVMQPTQLVFATGMSGKAYVPRFPGDEDFKGILEHSSVHTGGSAYAGKKCVVVGSNNSAHDICAALWENGADVTMLQKSSTHISRSDSLMKLVLGGLYSEEAIANGIDHHKADFIFASIPYKVLPALHVPVFQEMAKKDADFYSKLEKVGFMHDFGEDGSGLFLKYLRRGSGYYIDVGACDLVISGDVKLKSNVTVEKFTENSVMLSDGSELPADVIVLATGYGPMNAWVADVVSKEMAEKVGKCWGLGSNTTKDPGPWEGELRNMWKPTAQENLWFQGGNLHQNRHYSKYLALQLKARYEGIDTPVYGRAEVHHAY